jgi:hypothetical protein
MQLQEKSRQVMQTLNKAAKTEDTIQPRYQKRELVWLKATNIKT